MAILKYTHMTSSVKNVGAHLYNFFTKSGASEAKYRFSCLNFFYAIGDKNVSSHSKLDKLSFPVIH